MAHIFGSIWDRFNRNALNDLSKNVEIQGKTIQDLVVEGQLTPDQYTQLIQSVNGLIAKGEISTSDIDKNNFAIDETMITDSLRRIVTGDAPISAVPADNSITTNKLVRESVTYDKRTKIGDFAIMSSFEGPIDIDFNAGVIKFPGASRISYGNNLKTLTGLRTPAEFDFSNYNNNSMYIVYYNTNAPNHVLDFKVRRIDHTHLAEESEVVVGWLSGYNKTAYFNGDFTIDGAYKELKNLDKDFRIISYSGDYMMNIDFNNYSVTYNHARIWHKGKRLNIENAKEKINMHPTNLQYIYFDVNALEIKVTNNATIAENNGVICIINPVTEQLFGVDMQDVYVNGRPFVSEHIRDELGNISGSAKYFILDDLNGIYDKPQNVPDGSSNTTLDLVNSQHSLIINIYDNLVSEYPNYVTKNISGQDSSGADIFEYSFKSPRIDNEGNLDLDIPKILIVSAQHGHEQASAFSTAMFFKDLCENWEEKEVLEFIKWNIDFKVLPVVNVWGYNNNSRKNFNGVDAAGNFFDGTMTGDPESEYFKGYEGFTEPETLVVKNFIDNNPDAYFFVDHHNIASGYPLVYTQNILDRTIANSLFKTMTKKWRGDYPEAPRDEMYGYIKSSSGTGSVRYANRVGMQSLTLETCWQIPFGSNKYDKKTLETAIDVFGNLIVTLAKTLR